MTRSCPLILLAAGQSTRMRGADKLMQPVDGLPLLARAAGIALQASPTVLVTLPPRPHPRHDALAGLPVQRVEVPDAAEGMNAGLRRAVAALPKDADAAMILLADLPDLTADDLRTVLHVFENAPETRIVRGATETGEPGHPVLFHRALFGELSRLSGDGGAQPVVRRHKANMRLVPLPEHRARLDLDTPEAWARWHATRAAG